MTLQNYIIGRRVSKDSPGDSWSFVEAVNPIFSCKNAFIGADGYDDALGFTGKDMMRSEVVQYMSQVSENIVIPTDSSKFQKKGNVRNFALSQVQRVITDKEISSEAMENLNKQGYPLPWYS